MNSQDASNAIYALAKTGYACDKPLRKMCVAVAKAHVGDMPSGALALTVWGLAKVGAKSKSLRTILWARVTETIDHMHAQNSRKLTVSLPSVSIV